MKKTIFLSLILSISAFADGQLCYQPDASQPDQICIPVSADVQPAIANYVASPNNQTSTTVDGKSVSTAKYLGIGDAIFQNIGMFFTGAVANFPPASVKTAIDAQVAQATAVKTAVDRAAPVPVAKADPAKKVVVK